MVKDINGLGTPPKIDTRTERNPQQTAGKAEEARSEPKAQPARSDGVELSAEAKTLKTLEAKVQQLPEVDAERVASIKAALESGEFSIDNQRLAGKILQADAQYGS